jgi:hypothetical protein
LLASTARLPGPTFSFALLPDFNKIFRKFLKEKTAIIQKEIQIKNMPILTYLNPKSLF